MPGLPHRPKARLCAGRLAWVASAAAHAALVLLWPSPHAQRHPKLVTTSTRATSVMQVQFAGMPPTTRRSDTLPPPVLARARSGDALAKAPARPQAPQPGAAVSPMAADASAIQAGESATAPVAAPAPVIQGVALGPPVFGGWGAPARQGWRVAVPPPAPAFDPAARQHALRIAALQAEQHQARQAQRAWQGRQILSELQDRLRRWAVDATALPAACELPRAAGQAWRCGNEMVDTPPGLPAAAVAALAEAAQAYYHLVPEAEAVVVAMAHEGVSLEAR